MTHPNKSVGNTDPIWNNTIQKTILASDMKSGMINAVVTTLEAVQVRPHLTLTVTFDWAAGCSTPTTQSLHSPLMSPAGGVAWRGQR